MNPHTGVPHDEGEEAQFEIGTREEIVHILRGAIERRAPVSVYRDGGSDLAITTLLQADAERDRLVFDVPQRTSQAAHLIGGARLSFVTSESGIKLKFRVLGAEVCLYEGHPALAAPLPRTLLRLQRREFFRIATPLNDHPVCTVAGNAAHSDIDVPVVNVGLGGVALLDLHATLDPEPGRRYAHCRIALPQTGILDTALEVCTCREFARRNGILTRRAGCRFVTLAPGAAVLLQRYIARLERARNPRFGRR